jgi:hypothetical protein
VEAPTSEETDQIAGKQKRNRSPGEDNIIPEMLINAGLELNVSPTRTPAQTTSTTSFSAREHGKHTIQHVYEEYTRSTKTKKTRPHAEKSRSEDTISTIQILIYK